MRILFHSFLAAFFLFVGNRFKISWCGEGRADGGSEMERGKYLLWRVLKYSILQNIEDWDDNDKHILMIIKIFVHLCRSFYIEIFKFQNQLVEIYEMILPKTLVSIFSLVSPRAGRGGMPVL